MYNSGKFWEHMITENNISPTESNERKGILRKSMRFYLTHILLNETHYCTGTKVFCL